ncbi:MAG: ribosomal protein S18-alanine N-acetyltransferase [Aeromicrobium sp.]|nr:ribosomal protein S18-alanine N-acetyltransferase [Burkholderiales bacterium]
MSAQLKVEPVSLRFQKLAEHQLPAVVAIESSVYAFPWTHGNFRDSLYSAYDCIGAWHGDELVGYSVTMPALEEMHLLNLAVAKHWQGRGIGATILQHLIAEAGPTKCEVIYLEVRPTNIAGLRLYARFGFRQLGLRRDYYPAVTGREDALFLGLNIKASVPHAPR